MQHQQLDNTSYVDFYPDFIDQKQADKIFDHLQKDTDWRVSYMQVKDNKYELPRLQCWMANAGVNAQLYQKEPALPWSPLIADVKDKLESLLSFKFDYVLMNKYRDGADKIGFHRDDEADEPGKNVIASLSFGVTRKFVIKPRKGKNTNANTHEYQLTHGSLIVMAGDTQIGWVHSVPPDPEVKECRINLTFRKS